MRRLCSSFSCFSFSCSCFRVFRHYVSIRDCCVGGQSIHFTFSTSAADMHADMQMVDRRATATTGTRAQNRVKIAHTRNCPKFGVDKIQIPAMRKVRVKIRRRENCLKAGTQHWDNPSRAGLRRTRLRFSLPHCRDVFHSHPHTHTSVTWLTFTHPDCRLLGTKTLKSHQKLKHNIRR